MIMLMFATYAWRVVDSPKNTVIPNEGIARGGICFFCME